MENTFNCRSGYASPRHGQHRRPTIFGARNLVVRSFTFARLAFTYQPNLDVLRLDNDSFDLPLDQVSIVFWRFRLTATVLAHVGPYCAEDRGLDFRCRDAWHATGLLAAVRQQRLRDIVPLPHASLVGMRGGHSVTTVVEDAATK